MGWHEPAVRQLQAPPVSACDHRPCGVAVLRFPLSLRLVEEMLLERGIIVSYETVRRWAMKWRCHVKQVEAAFWPYREGLNY
jgi:putative transposase